MNFSSALEGDGSIAVEFDLVEPIGAVGKRFLSEKQHWLEKSGIHSTRALASIFFGM